MEDTWIKNELTKLRTRVTLLEELLQEKSKSNEAELYRLYLKAWNNKLYTLKSQKEGKVRSNKRSNANTKKLG